MLRQIRFFAFALLAAATLSSCNLELGSGSTSAEIDKVLADRIAAENAANQPAPSQPSQPSTPSTPSAPSTPAPPAEKPSATVSNTGGGGGFLWKPISESNGNLVVLIPSIYNGRVSSVSVNGEKGSFSGIHNGNRTHWRFSKPGAAYGPNARVVAATSGGNVSWTVPNAGSRTTY